MANTSVNPFMFTSVPNTNPNQNQNTNTQTSQQTTPLFNWGIPQAYNTQVSQQSNQSNPWNLSKTSNYTTPVFQTNTNTTPVFQTTNTNATPQSQTNQQNDKSQILSTLSESKMVQIEILNVLRNIQSIQQNKQNIQAFQIPQSNQINQFQLPQSQFNVQQTQTLTHENVHCNNCLKTNIQGYRYKCLFCKDYDLCEACEVNSSINHDNTHVFLKIKDSKVFNSSIASKKIFDS